MSATRQSTELAWDITDWDRDADLSESNIFYNIERTFWKYGLLTPASIICRQDQAYKLLTDFKVKMADGTAINTIITPFGDLKIKVLPLYRSEITYTRSIR